LISDVKLIHFRNFDQKKVSDLSEKNFIIWENGKWKTNILEALSLLWNNSMSHLHIDNLVEKWQNNFYIEYLDDQVGSVGISFDKEKKKKCYIINAKNVTKKKFVEITYKCVIFSPQWMNLFYLSPSLRRDFLDNILSNSFDEYSDLLKTYKKIVTSRNKLLKSIQEWKSHRDDINFWNTQFIRISEQIYSYRFPLIHYFQSHIDTSKEYFNWKVDNIKFEYNTKVNPNSISEDIKLYLDKNFERDIILWKTAIWPHVDDFHVLVDNISLIDFASRWETKSVIIWLKMLETVFIEKKTWKKPILLIDDLMSELDENHKKMLTKKIKYYQTFISSISQLEENNNIIL
jgi:DNA replication and repair protein RecF